MYATLSRDALSPSDSRIAVLNWLTTTVWPGDVAIIATVLTPAMTQP
jgi:hypothetical protein